MQKIYMHVGYISVCNLESRYTFEYFPLYAPADIDFVDSSDCGNVHFVLGTCLKNVVC